MARELQNISTASFSFKWEFSVADDAVLRGSGLQAPYCDNLTWLMMTEKCKRRNYIWSHGFCDWRQKHEEVWRHQCGLGGNSSTPFREYHPRGLEMTSISSASQNGCGWKGPLEIISSNFATQAAYYFADQWSLLSQGTELTTQCRARTSWGCARLVMRWQTTLKYWITIPTNMRLYYGGV